MKEVLRAFGWAVIAMLAIFVLGFLGNNLGLISLSFFAPKLEQVRYSTFKQINVFYYAPTATGKYIMG